MDDVRNTLDGDVKDELKRCLTESGITYTPVRGRFQISRLTLRSQSLTVVPLSSLGGEDRIYFDMCFASAFEGFQMTWSGNLSPDRTAIVSFAFEVQSGFVSP